MRGIADPFCAAEGLLHIRLLHLRQAMMGSHVLQVVIPRPSLGIAMPLGASM